MIYHFSGVVFGVSGSPFLLNITLRKYIQHYTEMHPSVTTKLIHGLYADDVNSGGYSELKALEFYKSAKKLMIEGGFNLRKWASNSTEAMNEIRLDENLETTTQDVSPLEDDESYAKITLPISEALRKII